MYPQPNPYQPAPAWQPPRRWWQHPALIIALLVLLPPVGIALAWLGRWTSRTKIVATVLSALWFVLFLVTDPEKEKKGTDGDPKPAVTATATASPTPEPTTEAPTTEAPEPTTEAPTTEAPTPTPEPTTQPPTTKAPEPTTQAPTTQAPKPKPTQATRPPETAEPEPEPTTEAPAQNVYYANCAAVRAAGAAPIHAGDPGYSRKLDRDGDGVACE
ncbi:excalibur calcium-binding domain-containing protein [Streptomyces sp. NPDC055051]